MDTVFLTGLEKKWFVVDAAGKPVGRVAVKVTRLLSGKEKPTWNPHTDTGDFVIVVNANKVVVTGKKEQQKIYYHYSGYNGGLYEATFEKMMEKHPERVIEHAVRGMLPQGRLGRAMFRKLKVYNGPAHPHAAQNPQAVKL
ncbi:MAG: 50S ribosomal protein L13 [Caldisericales bacterium]|nr:50S ribosomal protein L13 [bacterium]